MSNISYIYNILYMSNTSYMSNISYMSDKSNVQMPIISDKSKILDMSNIYNIMYA